MCKKIEPSDARDFFQFSVEAKPKLPSEETLARVSVDSPAAKMAIFYIRQGSMVIQRFADCFATGQMDEEEVCSLYTLLLQSEEMLGFAVESATGSIGGGKSCIGTCSDEKKACKNGGGKQCGWNSFLCKANCFISVKVGGGGLPLPGG